MTTIRQARNSHFAKGQGVFKCNVCDRSTRNTGGDGSSVGLCELCWDLAGEENHLSDNGGKLYDAQSAASVLHALGEKVGHDKAHSLFPTVAAACIANIVKMPAHNHMEDLPSERAYIVFNDTEMVAVCARSNGDAKRQARALGLTKPVTARRM